MKRMLVGGLCIVTAIATYATPTCQQQVMEQLSHVLKQTSHSKHSQISREQANRYFQHGQFERALAANLPWAKAGDRRAQLEVGFMYEFGRGVKQDPQRAALWYFAATRPNEYNAKPLARGYRFFCAQHPDYATAARWFRMAAELGDDRY